MTTTSKIISAVLVAMLGITGCGADTCTRGPKCSADPKATEADIKACQEQEKTLAGDPCQSAAKAVGDCGYSNTVCTAENTTDLAKSMEKINGACSSQQAALSKCCQMNTSSKICGGGGSGDGGGSLPPKELPPEE